MKLMVDLFVIGLHKNFKEKEETVTVYLPDHVQDSKTEN